MIRSSLHALLFLALLVPSLRAKAPALSDHGPTLEVDPQFLRDTPDGALAEAWGNGGRLAYKAAAGVMARRHRKHYRLTQFQKQKLRPLFGSLVDRVSVSYGSQMMEEWNVGPWKVRFGTPSAGQTFGHRIYIKDPFRRKNLRQIRLLAHELVHSKQFERYGRTLSNFGYHYFKQYYLAGRSYRQNKLEREAYDFPVPFQREHARQELFGRWLLRFQS